MNVMRIAILGVAAIAAGAAALLVRGMLGGGTPATQAAAPPLTEMLDLCKKRAGISQPELFWQPLT